LLVNKMWILLFIEGILDQNTNILESLLRNIIKFYCKPLYQEYN
jgi:hypothetical protein